MNVLVIVADTFRRDQLGCYGGDTGTPNLDALAAQSVVFDEAYCASFPTLPCRAELFTGKIVFPYLTWGALPRSEVVLSEVFSRGHYDTAFVTDNLPVCNPGYGYDRGFDSRVRIRGQYYDALRPVTGKLPWPCEESKVGSPERIQQYLHNVADRGDEEDYFAPQTVKAACRWLEEHGRRSRFFLWVDIFDPHEPWDPPQHYLADTEKQPSWILYPHFGVTSRYTPEEMDSIRALYKGEVRMVDHWIGRLLARLDSLELAEETCVVFLSDHGILLGEHGLLGKSSKERKELRGWPPYVEISRIPFMMRVPGVAPRRTGAYVHPGDLAATLLELAGVKKPDTMRLPSLVPVLRGETDDARDVAVSSWSLRGWRATRPSVIRDKEWSMVFWRTGTRPELYHRPTDPGETRDVAREHPAEVRRMHSRFVQFLRENETPPKNYWPRRWPVAWESWAPKPAPAGVAGEVTG